MTLISASYIVAGIILPCYYIPQVVRIIKDNSGLAPYSMPKSATQCSLRLIMMPFVFGVGNVTMTLIVALDMLGRILELGAAVSALRRQGFCWKRIFEMCKPFTLPRLLGLLGLLAPRARQQAQL